MNDKDLNSSWAWSQIEAMADGSLRGRERQRMRRHMEADPRLRRAVEDAREMRAALRGLPRARAPHGLLRKLMCIPGLAPPPRKAPPQKAPQARHLGTAAASGRQAVRNARPSFFARPAGLAAAGVAASAIAAAFLLMPRPAPDGSSRAPGGQQSVRESQVRGPDQSSPTTAAVRGPTQSPPKAAAARGQTQSPPTAAASESNPSTVTTAAGNSGAGSTEALRQLDAALHYVRSSAEITRRGVARQVGRGFIEALHISRSALIGDESEQKKGG
jgi:hypothetical protein